MREGHRSKAFAPIFNRSKLSFNSFSSNINLLCCMRLLLLLGCLLWLFCVWDVCLGRTLIIIWSWRRLGRRFTSSRLIIPSLGLFDYLSFIFACQPLYHLSNHLLFYYNLFLVNLTLLIRYCCLLTRRSVWTTFLLKHQTIE